MWIIWIIIKILGFLFCISCAPLAFLLNALALSKKKLGVYIKQIDKTGTIKRVSDAKLFFDMFIALYIFDSFPDIKNNEKYNKFKIVVELKNKIDVLTPIVKFVALICGISTILLIVLLNIFGEPPFLSK